MQGAEAPAQKRSHAYALQYVVVTTLSLCQADGTEHVESFLDCILCLKW